MIITDSDRMAFTRRTQSHVAALRQQIMDEAVAEFGPRFPTVEVAFGRGRKTRTLPVEGVEGRFDYDGSGPPTVVLIARTTHPETGEPLMVRLATVGYGF